MPNIRILKSAENHSVPVTNGTWSADIPVDGAFHAIHEELLSVLADSGVQFEVEGATENAEAPGGSAAAEGAAGLGGVAAPSALDRVEDAVEEAAHALAAELEALVAKL